ncbi:protein TonB-like [Dioscorea cayenensis subsp. rotundata]|uniref:Protein TonB-like n=1 Tax=Dioscorea cayennensis subsp. rotundata TaxID=55577 RepID=A0AB40D552_DIOCR|nr:protein TonB-like [Dioscorea cayenensis subsp. rotundata]
MAKLVEDKCNAARPRHWTNPPFRPSPPQTTPTPPTNKPPLIPIKRLTPAKMSPLSTPQFLCLMVEKDTNENDFPSTPPPDDPATSPPPPKNHEPVELPKISFHALTGQLVPVILKLANKLH